jgi:hypothetical protein
MQNAARPKGESVWWMVVVLLVLVTAARLFPTYTIFDQTIDEPFHVACGMQWLDQGRYTIELQHPPLARVLAALGPYLRGARSHSLQNPIHEGNAIFYANGEYRQNLRAARLAGLPFQALSAVVVYLWGRRWFTRGAGVCAVLLFLSLPPILGHAGLATLDMACAATVLVSLYTFLRWVEEPGWGRAAWMGAGAGLAFSSKFSSFLFLPACLAVTVLCLVFARRSRPALSRRRLAQALAALGVALLVTWAAYRFSLAPHSGSRGEHPVADRLLGKHPALRSLAARMSEVPLPLTQIVRGLEAVAHHNNEGHDSFLLGEYRKSGWWYFFPVVLGVKTPLGFLVLALAGLAAGIAGLRSAPWQRSLTVLFPLAILAVSMASRINLGVRHILPVYPFFALAAGHAVVTFVGGSRRIWLRAAPVALAALAVGESAAAHPDYLAYFNPLAGSEPAKVLCDSDLDWGQDLHRLSDRLRALGVQHVSLRIFSTAVMEKAGLPPADYFSPADRPRGWVAVSARTPYLECAQSGAFCWLRSLPPVERIGKSIYLYYIPE